MAFINKTQARINIKTTLQLVPNDEKLNMLDELIRKADRGGRNSFFFKGLISLNMIMTLVMLYCFFVGNLIVAVVLACGAVPMWIQGIIMLATTSKNGTHNSWMEAAQEIRADLAGEHNESV